MFILGVLGLLVFSIASVSYKLSHDPHNSFCQESRNDRDITFRTKFCKVSHSLHNLLLWVSVFVSVWYREKKSKTLTGKQSRMPPGVIFPAAFLLQKGRTWFAVYLVSGLGHLSIGLAWVWFPGWGFKIKWDLGWLVPQALFYYFTLVTVHMKSV